MIEFEVIETSELGDRSYIAHDGHTAVVVDPQRDLDRIESVLSARGLNCALVLETHIHNDYVTGGYELARRAGAMYAVSAADQVSFERHPVSDGDELVVGGLRVRVIATPGHTVTHLTYVVDEPGNTAAPLVFTGGSLLYGSVGRTDLVDPARTEELTRAQFRSARRLAEMLSDDAQILPTHGFGSFCSSGSASGGDSSTMGQEKARNDALTEPDEDTFVTRLIAGLTAYPAYYAQMAPLNLQGPGPIDLSAPTPVEPDELRRRIAAGEWVVDLRNRVAYASEHLNGTVSIELGGQFSTYLGWLMPWGAPLTLIGASAEEVTDAQRQLTRIGIDKLAGAAVGSPSELADGAALGSYPRVTFADLVLARKTADQAGTAEPAVLDVRRADEHISGHLPGAAHVPLHALLERLDEVPSGQLWVHCVSGFRASIAVGLLKRAGRDVILIDDAYSSAVALGLTTD